MLRQLIEYLMRSALRDAFSRVAWAGPVPETAPDRPLVLYANHHDFYDGYLLWLACRDVLGRPALTWMEAWDRYPFFAAVGAHPFPPDDARRRVATLRRTARWLHRHPATALVYFPEGRLHPPDEGLLPIDTAALAHLDRLLPGVMWCPVGLHVTRTGAPRPEARLAAGPVHPHPDGHETHRIEALLARLRALPPGSGRTLLTGRHRPDRWNFGFLRGYFARYLDP
ncbi:MAG: acyltransferase [Rhodothermaceae bacterium]|nr:MAG: acyltransferase [Rhodothermaceae bacterium]